MTSSHIAPGGGTKLRASHYLLLVFICLISFIPGIASIPPLDRDEARYVQATHQMAESGDYVDIRFQDASRYKKPVGIYWLQSAALKLTGYNNDAPVWVYRLVSVAGATIAVLGTAALGAFLFGQSAGLMAGIALAAIVMLGFEARVAKTDATVLATVVIAQGALASIWMASRKQEAAKWAPAVIFWVATAAGVLIKGPITPFVSLLTMGSLSLFYREWRWLKRLKPLSGIFILLAIVLPWLILITLKSGGAFFNESVNKDFLSKVGDAQESHGAPPGYFALIFVVFIWPFGVLAIRGGLQALSRLREDPRLAFLTAWYIPFWLVTELIPTKLPHYILPAYPALLLMMAWAIDTGIAAQPYRGRWQIWVERLTLLGLAAATARLHGRGACPALCHDRIILVSGDHCLLYRSGRGCLCQRSCVESQSQARAASLCNLCDYYAHAAHMGRRSGAHADLAQPSRCQCVQCCQGLQQQRAGFRQLCRAESGLSCRYEDGPHRRCRGSQASHRRSGLCDFSSRRT